MALEDKRLTKKAFNKQRREVLATWPTGEGVEIADGVAYQQALPQKKSFAAALDRADRAGEVLLQPRAGVALVEDHIKLLKYLESDCDLLPTTIDAYTRQNRYDEAAAGIAKSEQAQHSLLNGFPAVNHGLAGCRQVIDSVNKPVEVRHGTPDARLLAEITLAAGFSSFEGGGISYNIPYAKKIPLERSIADWQYVDRLAGLYEEAGARVNREPFGPLSGTLVPPFISHTVAIIEGLLALRQGVRSLTLGYGQAGNLVQDVAAMLALRTLADDYFHAAGYDDYQLTTVFHQWMGGFPEDEAKAFGVIGWGATVAALAKATKVIVKTPHEAMGIPTREANRSGLRTTRQLISMLADQRLPDTEQVQQEVQLLTTEVRTVLDQVFDLGEGDVARGAVNAFQAGVIDVPFTPSICNRGKLLPIRDDHGAIRIFQNGAVPMADDVLAFHREQIQKRAKAEKRKLCFQMVIDDIYAISKGRLVGRPRKKKK